MINHEHPKGKEVLIKMTHDFKCLRMYSKR